MHISRETACEVDIGASECVHTANVFASFQHFFQDSKSLGGPFILNTARR